MEITFDDQLEELKNDLIGMLAKIPQWQYESDDPQALRQLDLGSLESDLRHASSTVRSLRGKKGFALSFHDGGRSVTLESDTKEGIKNMLEETGFFKI